MRPLTIERDRRTPVQLAAAGLGVVFLLVAAAGFIPGLTTDYKRLGEFGDIGAKLLGLFGVNWLENLVHVAYGVAGLALSTSTGRARVYLVGGGVLYLAIAVYGMVIDVHHDANVLGVNEAGNWLHLGLFVAMVGLGLMLQPRSSRSSR